jgi:hypothetical protein
MTEPVYIRIAQPQAPVPGELGEPQLRLAAPTNLSIVSLIPRWNCTDKAIPTSQCFAWIVGSARTVNWTDVDKVQVCALKLTDGTHAFYWATAELREPSISWQDFKAHFLKRFLNVRSDHYHYSELYLVRQRNHKTPTEFLECVW